MEHGGGPHVAHVGVLVFDVQLPKVLELDQLLHEGLDHRVARKGLLSKVGKVREGLLADLPLLHHGLAHEHAEQEQHGQRDQRQGGEHQVHPQHLGEGQSPQEQGVEEHQHPVPEALLDGIEVVGEQAHEVPHLVHLVILPRKVLAVVEHADADVRLHLDGGAEEAHPPQEPADDHDHDDVHDGQTQLIQQKVHGEGHSGAFIEDFPGVQAVDQHPVELRHNELHVIHQNEGYRSQQQPGAVFEIVSIDVLAEYQDGSLSAGLRPDKGVVSPII